jgi:MFS family permease
VDDPPQPQQTNKLHSRVSPAYLLTRQKVVPVSLWRNRDYLLLWSGQAISAIGSGVSELAFPLLVLAVTQSPAQAGFAAALRALPAPLFGLLAGVLVDRGHPGGPL